MVPPNIEPYRPQNYDVLQEVMEERRTIIAWY